jgi:hypothetical protein
MPAKDTKQVSSWQLWLNTLSPAARSILDNNNKPVIEDEEKEEYARFRSTLSEYTQEAIDILIPAEESFDENDVNESAFRYCYVEIAEEEIPVLRVFKSAELWARHAAKAEGKAVFLVPFYGKPLQISVGPQRYLSLPDEDKVMVVPYQNRGPCKVFDSTLLNEFVSQDNFFLGPTELMDNSLAEQMAHKKEHKIVDVEFEELDDDLDDDEDDEEGSAEPVDI